ncbi:MAG: flavodoxin family protein [Desulfobacterales bacterium]|nr:flavodoxin family protein [Desulfobacterales bacterium]
MDVVAINGSPRKNGNTATLIRAILEGAASTGAQTTEAVIHDLDMKGCQGCFSCRKNHGICAQEDGLSPYLEAIKTCKAFVVGCPIYMYRISGQMKLFVDRAYSLYMPKPGGGYTPAVPAGKKFALVTSQGAPDPEQYHRSIRWLAGMAGTGFGMEEAGRIIHTNSNREPARENSELLKKARDIGMRLVG